MSKPALSEVRREQIEKLFAENPPHHQALRDLCLPWGRACVTGAQALTGKGPAADKEDPRLASPAHFQNSTAAAEIFRLGGKDLLETVTESGSQMLAAGIGLDSPRLKRGRLQDPLQGVPLADGSSHTLPANLVDHVAALDFATEQRVGDRLFITLPQTFLQRVNTKLAASSADSWSELQGSARGRYQQRVYEQALALAAFERDNPERFEALAQDCRKFEALYGGALKPFAANFDSKFQRDFAVEQAHTAWGWRNLLEPGGAVKPKPALAERDTIMRNLMGVGLLEYLPALGREVTDYLRQFGEMMQAHPFRRTEIAEEHLQQHLPGVPLQGGGHLIMPYELSLFIARQHHELWLFSRELTWMIPDRNFHQPPREAHRAWQELSIATQNRDILNVFGIALMLAKLPEKDFAAIRNAAPAGNPLGLPLEAAVAA